MEFNLVSIATSSVVATALTLFFSYGITRRTLMAKVNDRLFDLDKLILANAASFAAFWALGDREDDAYFATALRTKPVSAEVITQRAFAFYYLNVFEEMYLAHHILPFQLTPPREWKTRESYIFERLKHPLIRETLMLSAGIKRDRAGLLASDIGHYNKAFVDHLCANEARWQGPRNPDVS
jgi:hypothetical protein